MTCQSKLFITLALAFSSLFLNSCSKSDSETTGAQTKQAITKVETTSKAAVKELKPIDRTPYKVGALEIKKTNTAQTCRQCHEKEFQDWQKSHHDLAMTVATDETVLADFNDVEFTFKGQTSKFYRKGKKFFVETYDQNGELKEYEVLFTFGWTPLQQYMVQFPGGRIQCLNLAWDTPKKKWFRLHPQLDLQHQEWLNWTGGSQTWNTMCSDCHSTKVEKNYDIKTDTFNTTFKDINVSCEACHGPGDEHIEWALNPGTKEKPSPTSSFKSLKRAHWDSKALVDQCARCHARREQFSNEYQPHETFHDTYTASVITDRLYHGDGQILDEDYVYGSFVQSKMYHANVRCNDCHNPHSLELKKKGDDLCLQCHVPEQYKEKHSFHKEEQASCIDCHMTGRYYMVNDFRRDHSFRIPRPDQSVKYGTPNACTQCHKDKNDKWAADFVEEKYGKVRRYHFSDTLLPAKAGEAGSREKLFTLIADQSQPFMARASAIWRLGQIASLEELKHIEKAMRDKEPLVRYQAASLLQGMSPEPQVIAAVVSLFDDEKKSVRVNAFRSIIHAPMNMIPGSSRNLYRKVQKEFEDALDLNGDFSTGRLNLANYLRSQGKTDEAEKEFLKALEIDDLLNAARINLAQIYNEKGKNKEAEAMLRKVIELEPEYPMSYYNLALLLAEEKRLEEAEKMLSKAITFNIPNPRMYFNWGVILENLKRPKDAEKAYLLGLQNCGYDFSLFQTFCFLKFRQGEKELVLKMIQEQIGQNPQDRQLQKLMRQLSR